MRRSSASRVNDREPATRRHHDGFMSRYRITLVCMGNICRSPIAEAVLRAEFERAGLGDRVDVDSAGTGSWHIGEDADPRAQAVLRRRGYTLSHAADKSTRPGSQTAT